MTAERRVALNALFLDPGVSGGSETYLVGLVPELLMLRPYTAFELVTTRRGAAALAGQDWVGGLKLTALPCDDDEPIRRTLIEHAVLPRLARRRAWDVLHSLSNRAPRWAGTTSVVTIHDVTFFHHSAMNALSTQGMRLAVRASVSGADALIAGSDWAADDIAATLRVERDRIVSIPHGPGRAPVASEPGADVQRRRGLGTGPMVLCVAAKRPHKNQAVLIDALQYLPHTVHLVLVGHDEGYGAELEARASRLAVSDRVHLLERVANAELEALWRMASCAALPTRAEGFGLPVLEAMRREVPVACSDIPVLREVGGDVPRYFDPQNAGGAASAIQAAMHDANAGARGRARAASFTWKRAAESTLHVYERALARRSAG